MSDGPPLDRRQMLARIGIALVQGVLLWALYEIAAQELWPEDRRGLLVGLICAVALVPLAHYVIDGLAGRGRQLAVLAALAALCFGLGWHHGAWTYFDGHGGFYSFPVALGVLIFHVLPFVQSALTRGRWRPRYEDLFHFAWRNTLLGALGALFTGVFWLLLGLWGALFHMLGIDVFRDLFTSAPFAFAATAVAVGIGVQLAGSVERLQAALRQQLLALLKWLAPLAILILVLFTVALLAKSPELFSEQRRAISAAWLLWLVALTVALVNAAYQDGREDAPYPRWLGVVVRHAIVLLLPVALLAMYAIGVRIEGYGITVARAWGSLVAVIALAYAAGYTWAGLRRGPWMAGIGVVNVAVALGTIVLLTLMLSPVLAPERLAAASQYRRALETPDGDAYAYLRFNSGRYGRERLASLAKLDGHADAADIRAHAESELARERPWDVPGPTRALTADRFKLFPEGAVLDPELLAAFDESASTALIGYCYEDEPCPLLFTDLSRDGSPEAIVFYGPLVTGAIRTREGWQMLDSTGYGRHPGPHNDHLRVRLALEQGEYRVADLPWQVIEINGQYYVLTGPRGERKGRKQATSPASP
jgi:hypothetical protein